VSRKRGRVCTTSKTSLNAATPDPSTFAGSPAPTRASILPSALSGDLSHDVLGREHDRLAPELLVQLDGAPPRRNDAILQAHLAERDRLIRIRVDARQCALPGKAIVRRVPHLSDRIVGVADPAVNTVTGGLPEPIVDWSMVLSPQVLQRRKPGKHTALASVQAHAFRCGFF